MAKATDKRARIRGARAGAATGEPVAVHRGSGNIFADLNVPDPDKMLGKAKLAHAICNRIEAEGMNQSEAARRLGVDRAKVSALVNGHLAQFSLERLMRFLTDLDVDVEIQMTPHRGEGEAAILIRDAEWAVACRPAR